MAVLAVTGGFVAFKNQIGYLQPESRTGAKGDLADVIPPERVTQIVVALGLPEAPSADRINRIELRPSKRMYKVRLEQPSVWSSPRELQIDAVTGAVLNDGVRGDQLWMDLHSFAVFGEFAKLAMMSVSALGLLWLCLSGLYLFWYPVWFNARRRRRGKNGKWIMENGQ